MVDDVYDNPVIHVVRQRIILTPLTFISLIECILDTVSSMISSVVDTRVASHISTMTDSVPL